MGAAHAGAARPVAPAAPPTMADSNDPRARRWLPLLLLALGWLSLPPSPLLATLLQGEEAARGEAARRAATQEEPRQKEPGPKDATDDDGSGDAESRSGDPSTEAGEPGKRISEPDGPAMEAPLPARRSGEAELSEVQRRVLEAWTSARTPGEAHEHLARRAGVWDLTTRTWSEETVEPVVTRATAHRRMILGGRYLEERVEAEVLDAPFEGFGVTGYDNVRGRWWSTWMDTMSTAPVHTVSRGSAGGDEVEEGPGPREADSEAGTVSEIGEPLVPRQPDPAELETEVIVMAGSYVDPLSGEVREVRTVTRVLDEDREVFEWWELRPDGSEMKTMEILYQRREAEDQAPDRAPDGAGEPSSSGAPTEPETS